MDIPTDWELYGDPFYWTQILFNLVENALKQNTEPGLSITVAAAKTQDACVITVTDTGVGIPAESIPFLFNRFGAPERSQDIVRRLLTDDNMIHVYGGNAEYPVPYVGRAFKNDPVGYSPEMDEDDGAMSAWYVFSASGFYPMLVGSDVYELVSPIFDKVTLKLQNGKTFEIRTKGRKSADAPVKSVKLNGKTLHDMQLRHADIVKGGTLTFCY